jgi:hypothetical protein
MFSDSAKGVLVDRSHLVAEPGQGNEQVFFCSSDCAGFDAYQLFRVSRVARVRWRPDRDHRNRYAEEQVSFQRNSLTIS